MKLKNIYLLITLLTKLGKYICVDDFDIEKEYFVIKKNKLSKTGDGPLENLYIIK